MDLAVVVGPASVRKPGPGLFSEEQEDSSTSMRERLLWVDVQRNDDGIILDRYFKKGRKFAEHHTMVLRANRLQDDRRSHKGPR